MDKAEIQEQATPQDKWIPAIWTKKSAGKEIKDGHLYTREVLRSFL
jgi:hypothetical protein